MSTVQPENGLPERRIITADSFRALKLRLSGGAGRPRPLPQMPVIVAPVEIPPAPAPVVESIEALPEVLEVIALPQVLAPVEAIAEPFPDLASIQPELAIDHDDAIDSNILEQDSSEEPVPTFSHPALEADALPQPEQYEVETTAAALPENVAAIESTTVEVSESDTETSESEATETGAAAQEPIEAEPVTVDLPPVEWPAASVPARSSDPGFVERRVLEKAQPEDAEAGAQAHELLDIMAIPTSGSLPQERALANDTLLRLIPRMPLKSLRHLAERVCIMEAPSQMLVCRLINDPRIEVSGPLLENAMTVDDSDLIAVANTNNPAKLKMIARRRIISPALAEALIQSNHVDTLINLVRNQGASFSIESMWRLTRFAAAHPVLQAPLVTRQDTPSPIAFQLFWRLPSELRRYVLSRFLTDSETITKILTMNMESDEGTDQKYADLALLSRLEDAAPEEAGEIYSKLTNVSEEAGARIADDAGGEALTVALKAAGLTRAQFAGIVEKRPDAEALKSIFETLSFNKARVLLTYWDWAAKRTGPYARTAMA